MRILTFLRIAFDKLIHLEVPPFASGAVAIFEKNKKILVIDLSYRNGYALPGGNLKRGENMEAALTREVKEETGMRITEKAYLGTYTVRRFGVDHLTAAYTARLSGKLTSSYEGQPKWVTPDEALGRFVYEDNRLALRDYLKNGR